jgi:hypothetical protein
LRGSFPYTVVHESVFFSDASLVGVGGLLPSQPLKTGSVLLAAVVFTLCRGDFFIQGTLLDLVK